MWHHGGFLTSARSPEIEGVALNVAVVWLPFTGLHLWPREESWTGGRRGGPGSTRSE